MKKNIVYLLGFLLLAFSSFFYSCSQEDNVWDSNILVESKSIINQTVDPSIIESDSIIPFMITPDSIKSRLFEKLLLEELIKSNTRKKISVSEDYYESSEDYLSRNMYAIRELPVTIQARIGGNTANRFLSTNGKNREVTLESYAINNRQKFYIRILPGSSGIPYLIYSQQEKTPITVGYYNNNRDNRILFVKPDNTGYLDTSGWDLLPINYGYNQYYAIQSQSYYGETGQGPYNGVFRYVLEVKNNNKMGYAKYSGKGQQQFLIKPDAKFTLYDIKFYQETADVTERKDDPHKITTTERNLSWNPKVVNISINKYLQETSRFSQENTVSIDFDNPNFEFARPTVEAGRLILPSNSTVKDAPYAANTTRGIRKLIQYTDPVDAPERCLIEHTTFIKTYDIEINFTAKARYRVSQNDTRVVNLSGKWTGVVYLSPEISKPITTQRFFDLDTGEEIFALARKARK